MSLEDFEARWAQRERRRRQRMRARWLAVGALAVAIAAVGVAVALTVRTNGSDSTAGLRLPQTLGGSGTAPARRATSVPGTRPVPILVYHVINVPPAGAPDASLYVSSAEFAAQMGALKAHGWHAVTMDRLRAYWTRGVPLGAGKPIVLSFDNGYASQYTNAMPVLRRLGWVGVENLQVAGLPPAEGGLAQAQIRGLVSAGWELDTQGISGADLVTLDASHLANEVVAARRQLRQAYGAPVNWFCYPAGDYDQTVIDAVRAAGFVGSTTVVPGWAQPRENRYALPRLRVLPGTSPATLLDEIAAARADAPPPAAYGLTAAPAPSAQPRVAVALRSAGRAGVAGAQRPVTTSEHRQRSSLSQRQAWNKWWRARFERRLARRRARVARLARRRAHGSSDHGDD